MNKLLPLLLAAFLMPLCGLHAQTQLTDFLYNDGDKPSNSSNYVRFNDQILFEATTGGEGRELWVSDGSGNGTQLLKDIFPGRSSGIRTSFKESHVILGEELFFLAHDGENGNQIWSTRGTGQTTRRVTNLSGLNASALTLVGNQIFFLVKQGDMLQVWKSDGTAQGTVLVKDGLPAWSQASFEGTANGLFFFTFASKGASVDARLWRSDGSASGTFPLTSEMGGNGAGRGGTSDFTQYIEFNDELYFVVRDYTIFSYSTSVGIIKTDGSVANTVPVKAVHNGSIRLVDYADVIEVSGKLYFSFFEADYNRLFIWESDGTSTGTKKVYDESGSKFYTTSNLSTAGKDLLFVGKNGNDNTTLLKLNLESYAVQEIKELATDLVKSSFFREEAVYQISKLSENRYLLLEPSMNSTGGWATDLTGANTTHASHLKGVREVVTHNSTVYFSGSSPQQSRELWISDFTLTTPQLVRNINTSKFGFDDFFLTSTVVGNKTFFRANDGTHGNELWVYNSATGEKSLVRDIRAGKESSFPSQLLGFNGHVYFTALNENAIRQLWKSDGTAAGTVAIHDLNNYIGNNTLAVAGGKLFFSDLQDGQFVLYATDGTKTERLKEFGTNMYGVYVNVDEIVSAGEHVFFSTYADGGDLWRSDGTPGGTFKLADMYAIRHLTLVNGGVYFSVLEASNKDYQLWHSDGTGPGTAKVGESGPGFPSATDNLTNYNGRLVFSGFTQEHGREYWITDGTSAGTKLIADINPGAKSAVTGATQYALYGGNLYFTANDGTHGSELWKTDGTSEGTALVSDVNEGQVGSFPGYLLADGEKLYFSAYTAESGAEVWATEGTASTTKLLFDIEAGQRSSNPSSFMICNDELLFLAETTSSGRQLWSSRKGEVTGVEEAYEGETFTLYPNPTYDYIYIDSGNKFFKPLRISSMNGKLVAFEHDSTGRIYVGNLTPGLYILIAEVEKMAVVRKFLKR